MARAMKVAIVDDEADMRASISQWLALSGFDTETFPSAEDALKAIGPEFPGVVISDIKMPGMDGMALLKRLMGMDSGLPVIMITGHGDVPMAVSALKKGAFHFIEKPFNDHDLVALVENALAADSERRRAAASRETIEARLATLTQREREVMELILEGKYNKVIADDLSISMRTVEAHRSRIFDKMEVRSAVELAQLMTTLRS